MEPIWAPSELDYEHVICPDNTIKKISHLSRDPYDFSDDHGLAFGAIVVKGQRIHGWRRESDARFLSYRYSNGLEFLLRRRVLSDRWRELAHDPESLEKEYQALRRSKHKCFPTEVYTQMMTLDGAEFWTLTTTDKYGNRQPVHGAAEFENGQFVSFYPWTAQCPNANLMEPIRSVDDLRKLPLSPTIAISLATKEIEVKPKESDPNVIVVS